MKPDFPVLLVPVVALLLLGGCAGDGDFPSLAMRSAEAEIIAEQPFYPRTKWPAMLAVAESEFAAGSRRRGEQAFRNALATTQAAVAAAGSGGSESWVHAQQSLSRLETTQ